MDEFIPGQGRQHGKKDSLKFVEESANFLLRKFH
jgi:hypothetical protein